MGPHRPIVRSGTLRRGTFKSCLGGCALVAACATLCGPGIASPLGQAPPIATNAGSSSVEGQNPHFAPAILTLDDAYARARAHSEEILLLRERLVEAEINIGRAWGSLKPVLTTSFTFTHSEPKPPVLEIPPFPDLGSEQIRTGCQDDGTGRVEDPQACFNALVDEFVTAINSPPRRLDFAREDTSIFTSNVTWNLFNGRALPLIQDAYDAMHLERERAESGRLDILLGVARAYYAALASKRAIEVAERGRERAHVELALAEREVELGENVRARLATARVALSQAETDVRRSTNAHAQALLLLTSLTRSPEEVEVVPPPAPTPPSGSKEELTVLAFQRRQDLRAAELQLAIAERSRTEAWWKFAPTLSLFGAFRRSNVAGIAGQRDQWSFGVTANMLLYDGGLRYEDLRGAESRIRAAVHTLDALKNRIRTDVGRGLLRLESADLALSRARDALEIARAREALTTAQYSVGALRGIELKEANDAVLDAELAIIRAEMERSLSVLELQRAAGVFLP